MSSTGERRVGHTVCVPSDASSQSQHSNGEAPKLQSPPHRKGIKIVKDLLDLRQGLICVFQILGPFSAPGDQHPTELRVQGC
ncbi:hypothetical protein DPX16_21366 [Anabarilius grahami]|uniref:Uncharacterized protein n=1 Tax=Anabarilius grahami TaxID=495550 RepID=A0A3N0XHG6_ANAGA|nr:hypothetical protein DPX16_21366 [Anabarilius grahami]